MAMAAAAATSPPPPPPPPPTHPPPTSATVRSLTAAGNHAAALRALSSITMASPQQQLDHSALPPAIKSAAALRDARSARAIHAAALRRGLLHRPSPAVANALLTAYARCGRLRRRARGVRLHLRLRA
ncbi:hypothetical protein OsI_14638 [Oryza sativa Indica Group]|uniref:Pentatricopeptide repeat-containing protein n=1 Tax=Oryza sativa subsp. indica TaxID=39946 RepID=B8AUM8_ORYSI|nr:hypothetical protein OsI_14638 [Oryza sativa Indica Group]